MEDNDTGNAIPPVPQWADKTVIYEVNIRQYTPDGNFAAFGRRLPRLKQMGVDILWLMPVFPVSRERRKGALGSPYAVADFLSVNPEFGSMEAFKKLLATARAMGMRVILDWVPNHTGWDHPWIREHPDWYSRDPQAHTIVHPKDKGKLTDWYDVAELNYEVPEMREAMIEAMLFWLRETDADGFRFDSAHNQSLDFWAHASRALRECKPEVFLLAETEDERYRNRGYFDVTYSWTLHHLMNRIAQGREKASAIEGWIQQNDARFTRGYNLQFITNHDENTWKGTVQERLGHAGRIMAVLAFTLDGMPLIYGGQESGPEAGLTKRIKFFEKEEIDWNGYKNQAFFTTLIDLKHRNKALWNGQAGGPCQIIRTSEEESVFFFYREKGEDRVVVLLNLSPQARTLSVETNVIVGNYINCFTGRSVTVKERMSWKTDPWGYLVLSNK